MSPQHIANPLRPGDVVRVRCRCEACRLNRNGRSRLDDDNIYLVIWTEGSTFGVRIPFIDHNAHVGTDDNPLKFDIDHCDVTILQKAGEPNARTND